MDGTYISKNRMEGDKLHLIIYTCLQIKNQIDLKMNFGLI